MAADWYLKIADKEVGPLSAHQLRTMAGKGQIGPEDLVRQGDEGGWIAATRVKGLLAGAVSASQTPTETIPVAKLLTPTDGKSSKAKTPGPVHKKKPEPAKTAKAIEEPAAEPSLPPVVGKGSVPPPPPPPPLPVPSVAGVQVANEAAASPPAVAVPEAEPMIIPPSRHSPGIDLPFDVSPTTSSGAHARVAAADKTSGSGPGKASAAKEKPKFQINYTIVAEAVVVVAAAGLFIASAAGLFNAGKNDKPTASTPSDKPTDIVPKDSETPPDGGKKPEEKKKDSSDDLMGLVPVGSGKVRTASAKPQEKKPDKAEIAAKEKWFDASKGPAVTKSFSIAVTSARYSRVKKDDAVTLVLRITNNVKERRLKCQWDALTQVQADSMMVDSFDSPNTYRFLGAKLDRKAINPEEWKEATLYFEEPIKTAKYLHLQLPGAIFDEKDPVKLEIPLEMIKPADPNGDDDSGPAARGPVDPNKLPPVPSDQPGPPEKGIPGVDAPVPVLPEPPNTRWQPRGSGDVELADAERRRPAAVREQRITDFDDDPATVERYGQPSTARDPDRRGSRHAVQR